MESNPLLPLPEGMQIDQIQASENEVSITVIATHPTSCCPLCRHPSSSIHSRYRRTVRDAPCGGRRVQLALYVRKFFCRNPLCERKVGTRAPSRPGSVLGKDDDPLQPTAHLHRTGDLRQRRNPLGSTFGHAHLAPNAPAPHHGSARSSSRFHPLFGHR